MRSANAPEISETSQPNSLLSGRINAPGRPMAPAVVKATTKVVATITQP